VNEIARQSTLRERPCWLTYPSASGSVSSMVPPSFLTGKNTYSCRALVDHNENRSIYLGQDNNFLAGDLMMLQRLSEKAFGLPVGVDVGSVEGVYTVIETTRYIVSQF